MDDKQNPPPAATGKAGYKSFHDSHHNKSYQATKPTRILEASGHELEVKAQSLEKARAALEAKRESGPVSRRDPIQKAKANPNSLRLAINAKCYDCQGQDADPCVEWRIGNCEIPDCPLYPVRPYKHLLGKPVPASLRFYSDESTDEID